MAPYVIDPHSLLHVADQALRVDPAHQLVAPNSIRSEVLQLLLMEVRAGRRTESSALEIHERVTELRMRLLGDRVSRRTAWKIAREHNWESLHHAEYLAVARLQADALVSIDPQLVAAAADVVPTAPLEALLRPA